MHMDYMCSKGYWNMNQSYLLSLYWEPIKGPLTDYRTLICGFPVQHSSNGSNGFTWMLLPCLLTLTSVTLVQ